MSNLSLINICDHTLFEPDTAAAEWVVDLGANRGAFSGTMAERYGSSCLAVEPSPDSFEHIAASDKVRKVRCAVSGERATARFRVCENSESSSLLSVDARTVVDTIDVPTTTLDALVAEHGITRVDLLKMDVEGAEVAVFKGASDAMLSNITQISVEFHDFKGLVEPADIRRIMGRLDALGFTAIPFSLRSYENVLFLNRHRTIATPQMVRRLRVAPWTLGARRFLHLPGGRVPKLVPTRH